MTELQGKKRQQPSSCPENWLPAAQVVQVELTCRQESYAQTLCRHCPLRLQPHGRQRPGRPGRRPLAHASRAGEGVQRRQAGQPVAGLRDRGQQVRGPGRVPELPQRPLPAGAIKASRPASRYSTGRTAPAPVLSWPHREWPASITTGTAASGCPAWAA